jgi:hypothetical protein
MSAERRDSGPRWRPPPNWPNRYGPLTEREYLALERDSRMLQRLGREHVDRGLGQLERHANEGGAR